MTIVHDTVDGSEIQESIVNYGYCFQTSSKWLDKTSAIR